MPLPNRAYGRPGTAVFPPGWDTDHAQVIDKTHKATVQVVLPGTGRHWDETQRKTVTTPATPVYDGPASISPASLGGASSRLDVADDLVDQAKYAVTLLDGALGVTTKHLVVVTDCPGDPDLDSKSMRIDTVELGSSRFARHLTATLT